MGLFSWGFQGESQIARFGGILHIMETHSICFKARIGWGSNNLAKLWAVRLTLTLVAEYG
jgi:hypothetical protein